MRQSKTESKIRRPLMILAWIVVVALHLFLLLHAERHAPIFSGEFLSWIDFDTHAQQAIRATDALAGWGKPWSYDTQLLAGYPSGTVFEIDNKGWELWTYALWKLGLPRPIAFNLFVLFVHAVLPGTVYASARLFGLKSWEALIASVLAMGIWFFDGMSRWSWYSGGVSYSLVTFLFILPLSLFYAHLKSGKVRFLIPMTVVMSVGHLVHPAMFVLLVVPLTTMYLRAFKNLGIKRHGCIVGVALITILTNLWWLITAFRYAHYATDHEPFFVGRLHHLLFDAAGLIDDLTRTGLIGNRTGFRFVALIAGVIMLVVWKKEKNDRFVPIASAMGFFLSIAYLGGYVWVFRQIQPYRFVVPAALLAVIPAAALVGEVVRKQALQRLPRLAWAPIGLVTFLGASHLAKDVLYFFPRSLPLVPSLPTGEQANISTYGFPPHLDFRHYPVEDHFKAAREWVLRHDDGQGRFLVEWWVLGEHLLGNTKAQILGGFRERNMDHRSANLFQRYPQGQVSDEQLAEYLEKYAVRWVIVSMQLPEFESKSLLEKVATVGPHRMYRTKTPVSFVQDGPGRVTSSLNRIHVTETDPSRDVVLRFHWFETLVCEPDCQVQKERLQDNPVGFIRVPTPHPASFDVMNGY